MLRLWVLACLLLMSSGCELMRTSRPETPPPPPMRRVVVREPIDCKVPEVPVPDAARAANAADAATEETQLAAKFAQTAQRVQALWQCIERHNAGIRNQ